MNDFDIPESDEEYLKTIPMPAARSVREKKVQNYLDKDLAKEIKRAYYATTSFVDAQIGRVLDKLKETGLDKNTIVILTSDHGYHLGEHGHWQKRTLFNHATRVPLIFSGPGIINNKGDINDPVELVDIYPTIMDVLNIDAPKFLSGKSLKPYLLGERNQIRNEALTELRVWTPTGHAQGYSIKSRDYRFTKWIHNGILDSELYDLKFDSAELNNLSKDISYQKIKDSLLQVINKRIFEANSYPESLGRQIKNAIPIN
jgi:arylsulfatase A-like enzyme